MAHRKRLLSFLLLLLIYIAFISLGLPDSALGIAWPLMRLEWGRSLGDAGGLVTVITLFSALSGFASGWVLKKLGTGLVVWLSGLATALALLGFSLVPDFPWLFLLAVPLGLGAGSVDAGLNHYAARHFSARHMNWLHGFWGVGAWLGPFVLAWALAQPGVWRTGYQVLGALQLVLSLVFLISLPLWGKREVEDSASLPEDSGKSFSTPRWTLWAAPFLFYLYAALETGTALWSSSYLIGTLEASPPLAALLVSVFYGTLMGGRFLTGVLTKWISNRQLILGGLTLALAGAILLSTGIGGLAGAALALVLLGGGCAPVYPGMMHETPRRFVEEGARKVVGRQVAFSALGGATLPGLLGWAGSSWGLDWIFPLVSLSALGMILVTLALEKGLKQTP